VLSTHLRRLVRRIRLHWPNTRITIRGDSHYGRREAMDWCEKHGVHYIFGLSTNAVLAAQVFAKTDDVCACVARSPTWMWCANTPPLAIGGDRINFIEHSRLSALLRYRSPKKCWRNERWVAEFYFGFWAFPFRSSSFLP
jgi:hypothetical protein